MLAGAAEKSTFNHKLHGALKLACNYCHASAKTGDRAGFPAAAVCKTCHPDDTIGKFPVKRMYRVRDMVFFGHVKHVSVDCAECHGVMYETAAIEKPFRPTTMVACVDCHKQNKASINCSICHELGQ